MRLLTALIGVSILLVSCTCSEFKVSSLSITLSPERASPGETVTVELSQAVVALQITVAGAEVPIQKEDDTTFTFELPEIVSTGLQEVIVADGGNFGSATLDVFGQDILEGEAVIAFQTTSGNGGRQALDEFLRKREFSLIEFTELTGNVGPCSGSLARIDIGNTPLGEALRQLEAFEEEGEVTEYFIDPPTGYSSGTSGTLEDNFFLQTLQNVEPFGKGTTLAIVDTGVTDNSNLFGDRLLTGYNAVTGGNDVSDNSAEDHGTNVARIAAGSDIGIAKVANVLPVKVCDARGGCLGSDIIKGVCWALTNAPSETELALNFSLGGDTRMEILEVLLDAAIKENVFVSASAGNDGEFGPVHYPAAHDLDGLMAVGTVEQCISFDGLPTGNTYFVGDTFKDAFAVIEVKPFFFLGEGVTSDGTATINGGDLDEISNRTLFTGNTNLDFSFTNPLEGLTLEFSDQGGNINMSVNESFVNIGDLTELDGEVLGGVEIDIINDDTLLQLSGDVRTFAIGGQELTIDNVCANSTNSSDTWLPASFSTWGDYVDIAAPIPVQLVGEFKTLGTSFSAPVVAGVGAALRSGNTSLSPAEIQGCIEDSATALTSVSPKAVGAGLLNLEDALSMCGP